MEYCLSANSYYEDESYYWFSEQQYNGFYQVDKKTLTPELLFHFPEEAIDTPNLFGQVLKHGDWFVFAPLSAKQIILYHALTKEIKRIPLAAVKGDKKVKYSQNIKFLSMVSLEEKVYFFPASYPAVVVLDLKKMTLTYVTNWVEKVEEKVEENRKALLNHHFRSVLVEGEKAYLPSACSNQLVIFDLKNHQVDCVSITAKEQGFNGVAFDGSHFWLSPLCGREVVKWSPEGSETISLDAAPYVGVNEVHQPFVYENRVFFLACLQNKTYEVDLATKEVKVNEVLRQQLPRKQVLKNLLAPMMRSTRIVGSKLHFICGNDRNWYTYDLETAVLDKKMIPMDAVGIEIVRKRAVFCSQWTSATLMDFCEFVVEMETSEEDVKEEMTVGEKVLRATT